MTATDAAPLPCIVLARPMTVNDPCLSEFGGRYVFRQILDGLVEQGIAGSAILSLPSHVPEEILDCLGLWHGIQVITGQESPHKRLWDVFRDLRLETALVLTPYCCLLRKDWIVRASSVVREGSCDAVFLEKPMAFQWFAVMNRRCARLLSQADGEGVPPFLFCDLLKKNPTAVDIEIQNNRDGKAERFVLATLFAGERAMIPSELMGHFLDRTEKRCWFASDALARLTCGVIDRESWPDIRERLSIEDERDLDLWASQIHFLRKVLQPNLPDRGGRFLELGSGPLPLMSCLLLGHFREGISIEPFFFDRDRLTKTIRLGQDLSRLLPGLAGLQNHGRTMSHEDAEKVVFHDSSLETLGVENESVDFCFSRNVFEHVQDVDSISRELFRILKPGAMMIHRIDFRDHRSCGDAVYVHFDFLKYSGNQWRRMGFGTNLWRINDFIRLWEMTGFLVEVVSRETRKMRVEGLHESWADYDPEDLFCYDAVIKAIKPL